MKDYERPELEIVLFGDRDILCDDSNTGDDEIVIGWYRPGEDDE